MTVREGRLGPCAPEGATIGGEGHSDDCGSIKKLLEIVKKKLLEMLCIYKQFTCNRLTGLLHAAADCRVRP